MLERYEESRELRIPLLMGDRPERVKRKHEHLESKLNGLKNKIRKIQPVEILMGCVVPPARCCDCWYWSKQRGESGLLVCAVNVPHPAPHWKKYSDLAYARHYCPDFDPIAHE